MKPFTVSIEARGVTTGISGSDRARTVASPSMPDTTTTSSPGHTFFR
jgi:3,4-dihydroxy-2-butanone 4-phosphate synthase